MTLPRSPLQLSLPDEAATLALGAALAPLLAPGMTVHLKGDLGAGKTTLVRGILAAMGYQGRVKSPSYAVVEPYEISSLYLYHFDLYRFGKADDWVSGGFREYLGGRSISLIEWPEKAAGLLPVPDLAITLADGGAGRRAELHAYTEAGTSCLMRLPWNPRPTL